MKVLVCVKRVPDTSARIRVAPGGDGVVLDGVDHVVAPYDEFAMEDALKMKDAAGAEVVAVTVGDARCEDVLRTCLALGADRAVHVCDDGVAGSDSLGLARVLAAVVKRESPDVVYLGKQATDGDYHAVGAQLATFAGLPFVSAVYPLTVASGTVRCERPIEGGVEEIEVALPAAFSAEKSRGQEPRYATLKGIMLAKKKPVETLALADLDVDPTMVGASAAAVVVESISPPPERTAGTLIEDLSAEDAADKLLALLRDEAKVI